MYPNSWKCTRKEQIWTNPRLYLVVVIEKASSKLQGYLERLKTYAHHIEICGDERNSYSKTDLDATFMRIKRDYMGNDQLLPAYNLQVAVCDEYIAAVDVKPCKTICIRYGMLCSFDGKI